MIRTKIDEGEVTAKHTSEARAGRRHLFSLEACSFFGTRETDPGKWAGIAACIPGQNVRESRDGRVVIFTLEQPLIVRDRECAKR
jgi:hypothetical protein